MNQRQTFNVGFYCRKSKQNRQGLAPIELSINVCGERKYVALPRKERPDIFKRQTSSKRMNATREFCALWYAKVNDAVLSLTTKSLAVTVDGIKAELFGTGEKRSETVIELWNRYLATLRVKVGVDIELSTYSKYTLCRDRFCSFIGNDKSVDDLSVDDIRAYYTNLKRTMSVNTTEKYMIKLKSCLRFASMEHLFDGIKIEKEKVEIELFTDDDYRGIRDRDFLFPHLNRMRDLFVFCCNSGISYSDLKSLTKDDFTVDVDGNVVISKCRQKTGVRFYSVVLPDGIEVLKKYNYELPVISNQKGNQFLKVIAGICEVKTNVTFHKCRHYYATKLIRLGVDATIVQKCLGHSSVKMTLGVYTHLVESDVVKGVMSKLK